jgi:hypothetical protein
MSVWVYKRCVGRLLRLGGRELDGVGGRSLGWICRLGRVDF